MILAFQNFTSAKPYGLKLISISDWRAFQTGGICWEMNLNYAADAGGWKIKKIPRAVRAEALIVDAELDSWLVPIRCANIHESKQ